MGVVLRVAATLGIVAVCLVTASPSFATSTVTIPGLALRADPIVDVGSDALFSLSARSWPGPASASLRFVSPDHGYSGDMLWDVRCGCFKLAVKLGKRVHALESAHAWATVRTRTGVATAFTSFQIRGLAPGGGAYAAGGTPILRAWVGDPRPRLGTAEHYCAWVHAADAFGMSRVQVRFVVRFGTPLTIHKTTDGNGVACAHRPIGAAQAGVPVNVDIYAAGLHTRLRFTPRP